MNFEKLFNGAGQGDGYENGSSGDTSDDMFGNMQSSRSSERPTLQHNRSSSNLLQDKDYSHGLWSNSSRLLDFTSSFSFFFSSLCLCALFIIILDTK